MSEAYALINTAFGSPSKKAGSVRFEATGGLSYVVDLIVGLNVRDHYFGGFVNSTADSSVTEAVFGVNGYEHAHFDMLTFDLPIAFLDETLTDIVFTSSAEADAPNPNGKAFLVAATVVSESAAVPDGGSTLGLLGLGLGLSLLGGRRPRR